MAKKVKSPHNDLEMPTYVKDYPWVSEEALGVKSTYSGRERATMFWITYTILGPLEDWQVYPGKKTN